MAVTRSFLTVAFAAVLALAALAVMDGSPVSDDVKPALAGPCGREPWLHSTFDAPSDPPITKIRLYAGATGYFEALAAVDTIPPQLPNGKPPVEIDWTEVSGDPGIDIVFDPATSDGSFTTEMQVYLLDVPPGVYTFQIGMYCHLQVGIVEFEIWVDTCPVDPLPTLEYGDDNARSLAGAPSASAEPFPEECEGSGESPTPTSEPTPSAPPSETPTPSDDPFSGPWGDSDCSGGVDPIDSLKTLRTDGGLPVQQVPGCPAWNALVRFLTGLGSRVGVSGADTFPWGDADCSDAVDPVDSLKILRSDAGLSVVQPGGCPDIGEETAYELVEQ